MSLPKRTVTAFRNKDKVQPANAEPEKMSDEAIDHIFGLAETSYTSQEAQLKADVDLVDTVNVNGRQIPFNTQVELDIDDISGVFRGNHRTVPVRVKELASLIIESDLMHNSTPVIVRPDNKGRLELVVGTRRQAAIKLARTLTQENYRLFAIVEKLDDREAYIKAALENLGREELSPWEFSETLQGLLNIKAAKSVEDLRKFLVSSSKPGQEPKRNRVYFYLAPARLNTLVRQLIDEEKPCVFKDFQLLNKALNTMSITVEALHDKIKESYGLHKLSVKWLTKYINDNHVPADVKGPKPYEVHDTDGNMMIRIRRNNDGVGATIQLTGNAPEGLIEDVEALIRSRFE
jgi:ParB/RepB/Spo0J family partition protein